MVGNGQPDKAGDGRLANGQFAPGHSGNPKGGPKRGEDFGTALRRVADHLAKDFQWSRELAERLGLDPDEIKIQDLMAHGCLDHGYNAGRGLYFQEAIQRMFGKVPDRIEADINLGLTDEQKVRAQRIADLADAVE